jgi:hypothetical protein
VVTIDSDCGFLAVYIDYPGKKASFLVCGRLCRRTVRIQRNERHTTFTRPLPGVNYNP